MSKEDKPDAWMPLYIGDYKKDTGRLTTELHGAYLLLIMEYWSTGPLPDDDAELSSITCLGARGWKTARPKLARFFQISDGMWRHKRIENEIEKWTARKAAAIDRARKGGIAKAASSRKPRASSTPQAVLKQCSSSSPGREEGLIESPSSPSTALSADALPEGASPTAPGPGASLEDRKRLAEEVMRSVGLRVVSG